MNFLLKIFIVLAFSLLITAQESEFNCDCLLKYNNHKKPTDLVGPSLPATIRELFIKNGGAGERCEDSVQENQFLAPFLDIVCDGKLYLKID